MTQRTLSGLGSALGALALTAGLLVPTAAGAAGATISELFPRQSFAGTSSPHSPEPARSRIS